MGISWEYHGNVMGMSWECHGNIMGYCAMEVSLKGLPQVFIQVMDDHDLVSKQRMV
jgi:hypothetical protein